MLLKGIIILQILSRIVMSAKFPSEITPCNYGDSKCIGDIINDIFANKFEGFPQLGLPSLDPLRIDKIDLESGGQSSVSITLNFRNISFLGLAQAKVYKVSGFNRNPQGDRLDIRFRTPKVSIIGPYKILGRVLILPIQGDGMCNMTLDNVDFIMRFQTKAVERNGKVFMQIDKSKSSFETTRLRLQLTNLFSGNRALGDNMNKFINDNWMDILNELKAPIISGFGDLFKIIINHVFNSFPYAEIFKN